MKVNKEMIHFNKVGDKQKVGDLELTLLTNTEVKIKGANVDKLVNMRIDLVGLNLEVEEVKDNIQIRCVM